MSQLRPIHVAYTLVGCFIAVERLLRQGQNARTWQGGQEDKGSRRVVGSALGSTIIALVAAPFLNRVHLGRSRNEKAAWGGVAVMLAGLAIRVWASRVLGAYYTRTLRTDESQHLITVGPYSLVRHPGYLGVLLLGIGGGIASSNRIVAALATIILGRAYRYRIQTEEAMLSDAFPQEYPAYSHRTWRLIPFIY